MAESSPEMAESKRATQDGLFKIWDAGKKRWRASRAWQLCGIITS